MWGSRGSCTTRSKRTASASWGKGYFGINELGHVVVHPYKNAEQYIDLKDLIDQLQTRGMQLPILLRFSDILQHRIAEIADAFARAIDEYRIPRASTAASTRSR